MDKILFIVGAYLVGSLPFGVWVAKAHGVDILTSGSGNPGATNVGRTCGKPAGLMVFALDFAKGWGPAFAAGQFFNDPVIALSCGFTAILGHSFSPFLKFRGGKGISTGLGALVGSVPVIAGIAFATYGAVFIATRYVSLSSLVSAIAMVIAGFAFELPIAIRLSLVALAVFLFIRHRSNIVRLLHGTEPKFAFKSANELQKSEEEHSE